MATSELLHTAIVFVTGLILGAVYFYGLHITVRHVTRTGTVWLLPVSFLLRMIVLIVGIYAVSLGRWELIAVCMLGVLLARTLTLWWTPVRPTNV